MPNIVIHIGLRSFAHLAGIKVINSGLLDDAHHSSTIAQFKMISLERNFTYLRVTLYDTRLVIAITMNFLTEALQPDAYTVADVRTVMKNARL